MYSTHYNMKDDGVISATNESQRFEALQAELTAQFEQVFPHNLLPRTVVVVPSLSLDLSELSKISGAYHYEERMLCMLMLLRMPRTKLVYVTSLPIHSTIIDYYLHLLPGIPVSHAQEATYTTKLSRCFE